MTARRKRAVRRTGGYSVAEALIATVLVAMISLSLATGVSFAVKQYHRSMALSERKMLCSALTEIITGELRNTPEIRVTTSGELDSFRSRGFGREGTEMSRFYSVNLDEAMKPSLSSNGFGQLLIGEEVDGEPVGNLLLSSAAYTTYHLAANVEVTYDGVFHVTLAIRSEDGATEEQTFDVIALNDLQVETVS